MARPLLLCCLVWAAIFSMTAGQSPNFLVVAPRLMHVGVEETVWVQLEWPPGSKQSPGDVKVEIFLRNQITTQSCSKNEIIMLNNRNDFTASKTLQLTPQLLNTCQLDKMKSDRYVQLVAKMETVFGKDAKVVNIPVSYKRGYIFIQTDKSIYTPKQKVQARLYTLDHMMRPTEELVTVAITNAQGMKVRGISLLSKGAVVTLSALEIPDIAKSGVWRISAYFSSAPESNFTAEFEVKKYVLPNFEVKIIPDKPYFLISRNDFTFTVQARYVYGENVIGTAYARIGIINKEGQRTMLTGLEQQVKLKEGDAVMKINMPEIVAKSKELKVALEGYTLYIAASVVESASGIFEEKELTSVKIVTSPYKINLSKTKRYFTPGSPTPIVVEVSNVDGSSTGVVNIEISQPKGEKQKLRSDSSGVLSFNINTSDKDKTLDIEVAVVDNQNSAVEKLSLIAFSSKSNSFLHMSVPYQVVSPGEAVMVSVSLVTANPENVKKIHYMVLNKGQILFLKSMARTNLMTIQIPVTPSMIPSFRVIAYYYQSSDIIANSVWVDVTDVCEGKLVIRNNEKREIQPRGPIKLEVETDDATTVGLAAVDTAVYVLNSKNKLTLDKMFKAMNGYDLGCSPGGGKDYSHVFTDAGLAFVSSAGYSNLQDYGCRVPNRKKRSDEASKLAQQKVRSYPTGEQTCCKDGMSLLPKGMARDCNKRASRVPSPACRNAFLNCCLYAEDLRKTYKRKPSGVARTQENEGDLDFADESSVQVRSAFPESWLWRTITVNKKHRETVYVPDSITTWEIQAVGMSKGKGFCIAEPIKVRVFQRFHIHMRVPFSIKRFEQLELRPVLYNYDDKEIKVKVYMEKEDTICTPSLYEEGSGGQIVTVPGNSAVSVPFTVVPLGKSNTVISVIALAGNGVSDGVKKTLQIVREGVSVVEEKTYLMDPKNPARRSISIDEPLPTNMIPDDTFRSTIRVTIDSAMNTINNSLDIEGISRLIRVPRGCAEQTMILTAPGVYALRYLDHTEKWTLLSPDRKDQGLAVMNQGITRVLEFKKPDGSYGAWTHRASSTWLTAFIVKVMSLSRKYIDIDVNELRLSTDYLCTKQRDTGAFEEIMPVIHQDMQGGVSGTNAEVSLTAYVTVSLYHSLSALSDSTNVKTSINKAIEYLRTKLKSLTEPYPIATTAYALALTSHDSVLRDEAYMILMSHQQGDPKKNDMYFGPKTSALAVETTAYALLTALLRKDMPSAHRMYTWLTEQQNYGGGFKSTQDTVMALEALSEYWIVTSSENENFIDVEINSLERQDRRQKFHLRNEDSIEEEMKSFGKSFEIKVTGKGKATVTVLKSYNAMQTETSTCSKLGLEVTLQEVDGNAVFESTEDYEYEDYGEQLADEPRDNIDWQDKRTRAQRDLAWHDMRTRARREASQPKANDPKVSYKVCLWKKPDAHVSGMAVVDITMLSGFEPNTQDLDMLKGSNERYISHYESHPGRVVLYFDNVPDTVEDCVVFEAIQKVRISLLQPSSAVAYDFYEPETRCTAFYAAPNKPQFISTLCTGEVCQCAEGSCPEKRFILIKREDKVLTLTGRQNFACYDPIVKNGYRVKVEAVTEEDAFIVYKARIADVLQITGDEDIKPGSIRLFYQRKSCKMRLTEADYLIMGRDGETKDSEGRMRYFLDSNSWVEELPGPQVCSATRFRNQCLDLTSFMETYKSNGCQV
ncbi:complement C4-like [Pelobates fuscus]|uniref:complement C4-like n=1 Tax=Pelobates fuscus TaxID=191477 RepID=UPI002FE484AC